VIPRIGFLGPYGKASPTTKEGGKQKKNKKERHKKIQITSLLEPHTKTYTSTLFYFRTESYMRPQLDSYLLI
jgi:hypothetical protein